MPEPGEVVGDREARWSRSDDEHPTARRPRRPGQTPPMGDRRVAEEPLDRVDPDRLVDLRPVAGRLAGVETDPTADRGERVVLDEGTPRRLVLPGLRVVEPALDVLAGRAGVVAGRQAVDVDGSLDAPGTGVVRPARPGVERDRERVLAHLGSPEDVPPRRSKRRMLRSAIAWMRAMSSVRGGLAKRWAKRRCGRRYASTGVRRRIGVVCRISP